METFKNQIRQGDVLLTPVDAIPDGSVQITRGNVIVLAEGELTGHSHTIECPALEVETFERDGELYLKVNVPQSLRHQEHAELAIATGLYMVRRQTEVWMDEVRQVAD
jgi:hypothetical protein